MEPDLAGVLSFCNDVRQTLGRKPVSKLRKGCPGNAESCPIANTINYGCRNRVEVDAYSVELPILDELGFQIDTRTITRTPEYVAAFILTLDSADEDELLDQFEGTGWAE